MACHEGGQELPVTQLLLESSSLRDSAELLGAVNGALLIGIGFWGISNYD